MGNIDRKVFEDIGKMLIYIKLPLVIVENFLFSVFLKSRKFVEKYIYNPYFFGEKHKNYSAKIYKGFRDKIDKYTIISSKTLLELGPGGSLDFGVLALKDGLKKYYAIDDGDHTKLEEDFGGYKGKIKFINIDQRSKYDLKSNSIDIIYSCAVLEHVHDLDLCFSEMTRVLKKGGYMNHQIDLRDHIFNQRSLYFLKISEFWFNLLFGKTGVYVNRKRYSEYMKLFKRYNLKIIEKVNFWKYEGDISISLLKKCDESDLRILSFNILLQKK